MSILRVISKLPPKVRKKPKNVANWILNDLQSALSGAGKDINDCPIPPEALDELVNLIESGKISGKTGQGSFSRICFPAAKVRPRSLKEKRDRAIKRHERD